MVLYNLCVAALEGTYHFAGHWVPKARQWAEGRENILDSIRSTVGKDERIVWLHAASVGEFEQGRPIIEHIRAEHPEYKILVTFYSPSGYELRKNYKGADYIFYFPSDKPTIAKEFIEAIHPEIAIIVKYEFWLNTLKELREHGVRTFLICSVFREDSVFFKPYGGLFREALKTFETIFVQDEKSLELLSGIGVNNVVIAGDTRFDRVHDIACSPASIDTVERFKGNARVFVAGSTWGPDEEILIPLVNSNPDIKFIIAPHEMEEGRIQHLIESVGGRAVRYTSAEGDISACQVLVIDTIGLLSKIYRYADWAYIGGGFGVGIHNTVEPASYGLPIAFGPKFRKFNEARAMIDLGVAKSVSDYASLESWFLPLRDDEVLRKQVCQAALDYTTSQLGATDSILRTMFPR